MSNLFEFVKEVFRGFSQRFRVSVILECLTHMSVILEFQKAMDVHESELSAS